MAMTVVASVSTVKAAYDRAIFNSLRPKLPFDAVADVKPSSATLPGSTVVFTIDTDMAFVSTALDESTDVTPVVLADSAITLTLAEYGNAAETSAKLRGTEFGLPPINMRAASRIAHNSAGSLDTLARDELKAGSNVRYAGQALGRTTVIPTDIIDADDARRAFAELDGADVEPMANGLYKAYIHPDSVYDLRRETGAAAWRDPHTYQKYEEIKSGTIGEFEGFEWMATNRAPIFADAGSSTTLTNVYATIFCGRQALAKSWSSSESAPTPQVRMRPPVDHLMRFWSVGWYWLGGYKRFREAAIRRVEHASSIGANT
jgi:N4-gp56 family major capsid protein